MNAAQERIMVLQGGWTAEAEVSRASGTACLAAARAAGFHAEAIEMTRDIATHLADKKPGRVFNALHGQIGEDGNIQGLLNIMGIPYTHSGLTASAIAMDKPATKAALAATGIVFADDIAFTIEGTRIIPESHDGAIVIKPRNDGSSVGVVIAETANDIPPLTHWEDGTALMIERFIPGRELTVSVLDGKALTVTDITQANAFYDYEAKYAPGGSQHHLPADIPQDIFAHCMEWAAAAHNALGCRGVSRSDFRWDEAGGGTLHMLEINTQPGMTETSLVPEQARHCGITMPQLVTQLLEAARCD